MGLWVQRMHVVAVLIDSVKSLLVSEFLSHNLKDLIKLLLFFFASTLNL